MCPFRFEFAEQSENSKVFYRKIYLFQFGVGERDLDYDNYVSHTDPKFFDLETSPEQDPMKIDFKIGPNINTLDELRKRNFGKRRVQRQSKM